MSLPGRVRRAALSVHSGQSGIRRRYPVLLAACVAVLAVIGVGYAVTHSAGAPTTGTAGPAAGNAAGRTAGSAPAAAGTVAPGSATPDPVLAVPGGANRWYPKVGQSWQWQLSGALDTSVVADVYDVDGVETTRAQVAALHRSGRRVICYVNAGAYEPDRPDASRYPRQLLGKALDGWPEERWLDIRRWDLLEPLLLARFTGCKAKGFDAVEPDNVDAYTADSGFPLTAEQQLTFNRHIADLAHRAGLAVGLKNDVDQVVDLAPAFDFAVDEECVKNDECGLLRVFPATGKPVFHAEYDVPIQSFCPAARALRFSSIRKNPDLGAWRQAC